MLMVVYGNDNIDTSVPIFLPDIENTLCYLALEPDMLPKWFIELPLQLFQYFLLRANYNIGSCATSLCLFNSQLFLQVTACFVV